MQKFSDSPLTKCPECGKDKLEKSVSLPSFQLKGKGWYASDYKKEQCKACKAGDKESKKECKAVKEKSSKAKG
jgi:predicted nucleic acid-binding Zn ribbon protein